MAEVESVLQDKCIRSLSSNATTSSTPNTPFPPTPRCSRSPWDHPVPSSPRKREREACPIVCNEKWPRKACRRELSQCIPCRLPKVPSTLMGHLCSKPLQAYLVGGEVAPAIRNILRRSSALLQTEGWAAQPSTWSERRISVVEPDSRTAGMTRTRYDKAFCVEWIGEDKVAVSTKCGHILRVDRTSRTFKEVELEGTRWVEPPITSEDDLHRFRVDRGGIHCIRANSSQNLLACSGGRSENHHIYVLNLRSEKWATVRRGLGHSDWVFCLSWVSDNTFVTGSRDKSVKLWSPHLSSGYDMLPVASYSDVHDAKVRYPSCCMRPCFLEWDVLLAGKTIVKQGFGCYGGQSSLLLSASYSSRGRV
jgi:hypothetical protein